MEAESKIYKGWMPYEPDVKRILEKYPVSGLSEGQLISHEQLEEIMGLKRDSSRYRNLLMRGLGDKLREAGLVPRLRKDGLAILTSDQNLDHGSRAMRSVGGRLIKARQHLLAVRPERLTPERQGLLDHRKRAFNLLVEGVEASNRVSVQLPVIESLPRLQLSASQGEG